MSNPKTIPKKTEFKLAANLSDLKRVADILGCTPDKIKETLTTSSQATKTYLKAVGEQLLTDETKLQKYFDTIERLEGQLPVSSRKDFTSKETLDQSVSDSLVVTLGIRAVVNSEIASVLKGHGVTDTNGVIARLKDAKNDQETRDILKAAGVTEDQLQETLQKTKTAEQEAIKNKLLEAGIGNDSKVRNLIQMRLLLNIHEKVNLEELEEKKLQAKLEELEKKEKEFAKLAEDYDTSDKTLKNAIKSNQVVLSEKKLEKLTDGELAKKVNEGLYVKMGEDGGPFYVITEYSKENIQAVVKGLDHKSTINWHNIPKEHKEEAELECLRHAKKATFDDGKGPVATTLSKLMPEQPGDWQGWLKNIEDSQERVKSSLKSKLVQKVVGDNPEKLNEFWANISATKDPKLIKSTYDCMNPGQKKALDQSYIEQLGTLLVHQDSLEKKLESKLEAAQTKAKLSSVMKEYAELLGREFKPERINKKLEEVNKSLENKQTKLSPELKREFDKFIEKVSDQAYGGGEKKKEQKKEEQKEEEEKKPSLNI